MITFPLSLINPYTRIDFIKQKRIAYIFSILITVLTLVFCYTKGLNFGIDFTGGIIIELKDNSRSHNIDLMRKAFEKAQYQSVSIQHDSENNILIRLQPKNDSNYNIEIDHIKSIINQNIQEAVFRKVDYVGPRVGQEMVSKGILAVIAALVSMMIYVTIRFNWKFGLGVVIALFHDIIAMIGFYLFSRHEFDITSIAAILTIIGYSVNDSVVIYDRIRENIAKHPKKQMSDLINLSINETLSRTIMTVATTLVVCIALVAFGGPVLRGFSSAMLFGIAFGTYSSIYISACIIMSFEKKSV